MRYSEVRIADSTMVSHKRLQQYKRYYGKTLMTGLYGCRWHRYQQSRDNTSIWDLGWFCCLVLLFFFMLLWLFYWIAAFNDAEEINELISELLSRWYDWHTVLLAVTIVTFSYVALLLLLSLLHTYYGHEMYMHKLHKGLLLLVLTACITATNCTTSLWPEGWTLIYLSILGSWPFIHLTVVVVLTLLTFVIARRWIYLYTIGARVAALGIYLIIVIFIYLSPLLVEPPCVQNPLTLPARPGIIAHRGGAALAPENTLLAYNLSNQYAHVVGFECDVQISLDGVPFLLHDRTLDRTTDVAVRYPGRETEPAYNFNISDLQTLDAGSWFIETNPYGNQQISQLTQRIKAQTIPTFMEVLKFVKETNKLLLIDIKNEPPPSHPYSHNYKEIIFQTLLESKISPQKILWPYYYEYIGNNSVDFMFTASSPFPPAQLVNESVRYVNLYYDSFDTDLLRDYRLNNISTNLYTVNSLWFYSLCWCAGPNSVTTNRVDSLSNLQEPTWIMSPLNYLIMWVVTDVVSGIIIISIFVYNRVKKSGVIFNPETLSLQAMQHRISQTKQNRNMKEKLLHAAESIQDMENGISGVVTPTSPITPVTPATPATLETPTTPLSPTTPNLTIHANGHHSGNISFSTASGYFRDNAVAPKPVNVSEGSNRLSEVGVYNEALSPKTGHEGSPVNGTVTEVPHSEKPNDGLTDNQVRGFFESPPLKTEHYRSLSDNLPNRTAPDKEQQLNNDKIVAKQQQHPRNFHHRSSSATIPNTFFPEANGAVSRKSVFADGRSASVNSDVIPRDAVQSDFDVGSVPSHYSQIQRDNCQVPGLYKEGINHTDISIEVS